MRASTRWTSASARRATDGSRARELVEACVAEVLPRLGPYVFARGDETWVDALAPAAWRADASRSWRSARRGQLAALLGDGRVARLRGAARGAASALAAGASRRGGLRGAGPGGCGASDVGLAVRVRERGGDTAVTIAVALDGEVSQVTRTAFLGGESGRRRAALLACAELWTRLG